MTGVGGGKKEKKEEKKGRRNRKETKGRRVRVFIVLRLPAKHHRSGCCRQTGQGKGVGRQGDCLFEAVDFYSIRHYSLACCISCISDPSPCDWLILHAAPPSSLRTEARPCTARNTYPSFASSHASRAASHHGCCCEHHDPCDTIYHTTPTPYATEKRE